MLHSQINLDSKFQLQQTIWTFGKNFQINYFYLKTQKNEHTIAIFWTKFSKNGSYFHSKT